MPRELLRTLDVEARSEPREWTVDELRDIAKGLGVSREALLLRFVSVNRATWDHYRAIHKVLQSERREIAARKKGRVVT